MSTVGLSTGQKIFGRLLASIFSIGLLLLPIALYGTLYLANVTAVKEQLLEAKVYTVASDVVARQVTHQAAVAAHGHSIDDAVIKKATRQTFTPEVVQDKVEPLIDKNYLWLDGKRSKPALELDIKNEQKKLTAAITKQVTAQYKQRPICSLEQAAAYQATLQANPLEAPCRIDMHNTDDIRQFIQQRLAADTPEQAMKVGLRTTPKNSQGQSILEEGTVLKTAYWWLKHGLLVVLASITLTVLAAGLLLRSWVHWVDWMKPTLLSSGLFLLVAALIGFAITQTGWLLSTVTTEAIQAVIKGLARVPLTIIALVAGMYIVAAVSGILITKRRRQHDELAVALSSTEAPTSEY